VAAGGIVVDGQGRRFCREDVSHSTWAANLSESANSVAIALWDQQIHTKLAETSTMRESQRAGAIVQGADASELSATLRLDCGTLTTTIAEYNDAVTSRLDRLGRQLLPQQLRPPLYAARIVAALAHTQGGLKIDVHGRVLTSHGNRIPHLYAVGGAAVGVSGPRPDGYLAGNGLLTTYTLGWMVGQFIAGQISAARTS
jgi:fumarate reductase flavoprotein subunit